MNEITIKITIPKGFYIKKASVAQLEQGIQQMLFHTLMLDTLDIQLSTENMEVRDGKTNNSGNAGGVGVPPK